MGMGSMNAKPHIAGSLEQLVVRESGAFENVTEALGHLATMAKTPGYRLGYVKPGTTTCVLLFAQSPGRADVDGETCVVVSAPRPIGQMSVEELRALRTHFRGKIDGPENNHRTTAEGSMTLDYWFDMVEQIDAELRRRELSLQ